MHKKLARLYNTLSTFILGAMTATLIIGYVFTQTTVSYRSTLFPEKLVRIQSGSLKSVRLVRN